MASTTDSNPPKDVHGWEAIVQRVGPEGQAAVARLAADEKHLYWDESSSRGHDVYMADKNGGNLRKLGSAIASRSPSGFILEHDQIHLLDWNSIFSFSTNGNSEPSSLELPESYWTGALEATKEKFYVVQSAGSHILEIDRETKAQVRHELKNIDFEIFGGSTFANLVGSKLYISAAADQRIIVFDVESHEYEILVDRTKTDPLFPPPHPQDLNRYGETMVHKGFLYWVVSRDAMKGQVYARALFRIPIHGGAPEKLAEFPEIMGVVAFIEIDRENDMLYIQSGHSIGRAGIYQFDLATNKSTMLAKGVYTHFGFVFNDGYLYYASKSSIKRLRPPGRAASQ